MKLQNQSDSDSDSELYTPKPKEDIKEPSNFPARRKKNLSRNKELAEKVRLKENPPDNYTMCKELIKKVNEHPNFVPFKSPNQPESNELLSKVNESLDKGNYETIKEFIKALKKIWEPFLNRRLTQPVKCSAAVKLNKLLDGYTHNIHSQAIIVPYLKESASSISSDQHASPMEDIIEIPIESSFVRNPQKILSKKRPINPLTETIKNPHIIEKKKPKINVDIPSVKRAAPMKSPKHSITQSDTKRKIKEVKKRRQAFKSSTPIHTPQQKIPDETSPINMEKWKHLNVNPEKEQISNKKSSSSLKNISIPIKISIPSEIIPTKSQNKNKSNIYEDKPFEKLTVEEKSNEPEKIKGEFNIVIPNPIPEAQSPTVPIGFDLKSNITEKDKEPNIKPLSDVSLSYTESGIYL